jgi:hypothetical protein
LVSESVFLSRKRYARRVPRHIISDLEKAILPEKKYAAWDLMQQKPESPASESVFIHTYAEVSDSLPTNAG